MGKKELSKIKFNPRTQDWFNITNYINVLCHIKRFKEKNVHIYS